MEETKYIIKPEQSIELTKNSRGYNWKIKLLSHDIDKLEKLDNEMIKKFGKKTLTKLEEEK